MNGTPSIDDPGAVEGLRAALVAGGYTGEAIERALGMQAPFARERAELPLLARRLPSGERTSTLIALFFLGLPVQAGDAEAALAPASLDRLVRIGLLARQDGAVAATVELAPTEDFFLAYDPQSRGLPDEVVGMSPSTRALASRTVRRPVGAALDVGTGSGLHALLAAQHAERAVGVDINPRALGFAEFNALLNGVRNVEFREGDMLAPVANERFDLIVCNPPYVVSPDMELIYRDSGLPGDSFSELVVRDLPAALTDGGLAHALVTWTHGADEDWTRPVRDWLRGSSCDALVFREATHEPLSYAASWNEGLPAAALAETLDRWTGYYRRLGIERISWGTVVLRRRPGTNWAFFASPEGEVTGPAGEHLLRLFAARDYLAGLPADDALLDAALALAPEHRLDQEIRVAGGEATIERSLLRLEPGIGFRVPVDGATALVLAHLDGRRSVRAAVGEAARSAGPDTDPRGLEPALLPPLRRLLELGFLVPGAS